MYTFTKKGSRDEKNEKNARSILKFAQDLNKELTMRYFDNKDLVRMALGLPPPWPSSYTLNS